MFSETLLLIIRAAKNFAIIADETQDISAIEQFAVSLRWVDEHYLVHEDVIGLIEVENTNGATLAAILKDVLVRCELELNNCMGQAYDGASNMSGCFKGVASRIIKEEPTALYVHCSAHCLNLCLQECSHKCTCIRDALSLTREISNLIRNSPKRLASFKCIQHSYSSDAPNLKPLCPTCWTVRTAAIKSLLVNYPAVIEELEEIGKTKCESSSRAVGIIALMDKFSTYFGLKLAHLVFGATEQVSITLQHKEINAHAGGNHSSKKCTALPGAAQDSLSFQLVF